jgi:hypothetical protein
MKKESIGFLITSTLIILTLFVLGGYSFFEPLEIGAVSDSATTTVTLIVVEEISLTAPSDITMTPNITASQNSSIGTGNAWNVKTNAQAGYTLALKDDGSPALQDATTSETFSDASTTPSTWGFSAGQSCDGSTLCFGFSVYGNDVATTTWGTGSDCGSGGTPSATLNYSGFNGTTDINVATSSAETSTSGTDTVLCVAAQQNGVYAPSGHYQTTITGTATTQ